MSLREFLLWYSGVRVQHYLYSSTGSIPHPLQWVKDLALLQLWHRSKLQLRFIHWPRNFHMLWVQLKTSKQTKIRVWFDDPVSFFPRILVKYVNYGAHQANRLSTFTGRGNQHI